MMLNFVACWNIRLYFIPLILRLHAMQVDLGVKKISFDIYTPECQIICLDPENDRSQERLFSLKYTLSKQKFQRWEEKTGQFQRTNEASQDRPGTFGPGVETLVVRAEFSHLFRQLMCLEKFMKW